MTATAALSLRKPSVIPGFRLAFGFAVTYLSLVVLLPLAGLVLKTASLGGTDFVAIATGSRTLAALRISFGLALAAATINAVFGLVIAWVLVRYRFPGRRLLDAFIDLPFALPTAVAGIALTALYVPNGWVGRLVAPFGLTIAYTPLGILVALVFVGLPFIVRTVQPVLEDLDRDAEEAAATLGAGRPRTVWAVVMPMLLPSLLIGFALALARAIGEYGSVIFIAGNIPYVSEIAPLLIVIRLQEYDYAGATAIATVMLAIAFLLLLAINLLQAWTGRRLGRG